MPAPGRSAAWFVPVPRMRPTSAGVAAAACAPDPIALEDQRRHRVIGHRRNRDPAEPAARERHPQELGHVVSLEADGPPALRERQGERAIDPLDAGGKGVDEAERQRPRLVPARRARQPPAITSKTRSAGPVRSASLKTKSSSATARASPSPSSITETRPFVPPQSTTTTRPRSSPRGCSTKVGSILSELGRPARPCGHGQAKRPDEVPERFRGGGQGGDGGRDRRMRLPPEVVAERHDRALR